MKKVHFLLDYLGLLTSDPLCVERAAPESENECCVLVVCASAEEEEENERRLQEENIQFLQITPTTIQVQFPGKRMLLEKAA